MEVEVLGSSKPAARGLPTRLGISCRFLQADGSRSCDRQLGVSCIPGGDALPVRRLEAFQLCRMGAQDTLVPVEDVGGAHAAARAQGTLVPADNNGRGEPFTTERVAPSACMHCSPVHSAGPGNHFLTLAIVSSCSCAHHGKGKPPRLVANLSPDALCGSHAGTAQKSFHVRTGPLLDWCIDYSSVPAVCVATEHAWCAGSLNVPLSGSTQGRSSCLPTSQGPHSVSPGAQEVAQIARLGLATASL